MDLIEIQENIDDKMLISLARENTIIYDKTLKDYKDKELKNEIWRSIGEILGCTG